jgi:hypothetical protein
MGGGMMNEDKQAICSMLLKTIRLTRNGSDVKSLEYKLLGTDNERVQITYTDGSVNSVNVSMDSGEAMIRDIMKNI